MRVLHVIARMNVGGTATYLHSLITGLSDRGVSELLAVGHVESNELEDSKLLELNHHRISNMSRSINPIRDCKTFFEFKRLVKEFKPDIIHSHTFKAGFISRVRTLGIPNVHTFHGHHLHDPEFGPISQKVMNLIETKLAKKSVKLITIGIQVGDELLSAGIGTKSKYISIPPGIKVPVKPDSHEVRARFGFRPSDFIVVWMGRFTQVKRPELVVNVARRLPNIVFVMAGGGELFDEIKDSATNNLHLLGVRKASDMWALADVGLLTSKSEGMPLSVIEAQRYGVPVIATNVGSVSEIIKDGLTGVLVNGNADDIVDAIQNFVANPKKVELMGRSARERASELFSQDMMINQHLKVYNDLLDKVSL